MSSRFTPGNVENSGSDAWLMSSSCRLNGSCLIGLAGVAVLGDVGGFDLICQGRRCAMMSSPAIMSRVRFIGCSLYHFLSSIAFVTRTLEKNERVTGDHSWPLLPQDTGHM